MPRPRIAAALDRAAFVTAAAAVPRETASAAARFDSLTRHLAARTSRRVVLEAALGGLLAALGLAETEAACQPGEPCDCRRLGKSCTAKSQCCSKLCDRGSGTCVCRGTGKPCATNSNCCSKRCGCAFSGQSGCYCREANCRAPQQECDTFRECCSGYCTLRPPACGSGKRCCQTVGQACKEDCDCCGGFPETVCRKDLCCVAEFGACKTSAHCCGNLSCNDGVCCRPLGKSCSKNESCCSGLCLGTKCALPPG